MNLSKRFIIILSFTTVFACQQKKNTDYNSWSVYGGNKENNHYSSLTQMDTGNVAHLEVAWEYHTTDADSFTQIQVNPIIVDNVLYGVSPKLKLFALDAASGKSKWVFDPLSAASSEVTGLGYFSMNVCRGVTFYNGGENDQRIFYGASSKLYCINAQTGKPVESFGNKGAIDLHNDLGFDASKLYIALTTPGVIYKDMIIVGGRVSEEMPAAPGHIRAYDVHTGKLRWIFHTIPQPGEEGFETWDDKEAYKHVGGANVWSGFSLDEVRGIVFAPVGSAVYDFYGGKRLGKNLYANSLIAIDAATGKRIWHFQTVHHDIWDRDLPTAPALVTIMKDGKKLDAVVQVSKSGFVFLFDRVTGEPVYPIEEKPVPVETDLAGEKPYATQPWPTKPHPFVRQSLTEKDLNTIVADSSYNDIKNRLLSYKTGFMFTSPSKQGTVIFPGFDGGAEWGGPAVDPQTGIMYVNASEMPWVLTMVDAKEEITHKKENNLEAGKRIYMSSCKACHGESREGNANFPTLLNLSKKYNVAQLTEIISAGRRMMPAFAQLSETEKQALAVYLLNITSKQSQTFIAPIKDTSSWNNLPYRATGYNKFLTKEGYPAVAPPWGTLSAINLNTGEYLWKDPLGDYPELKAKGIHSGTENYGGPVVTAGGLLFIAATSDSKIRAFNKRNGQLLWERDLPACGFATPSVYAINGKQYLVIACGGGKLKKKSGDTYLAFALPGKQ